VKKVTHLCTFSIHSLYSLCIFSIHSLHILYTFSAHSLTCAGRFVYLDPIYQVTCIVLLHCTHCTILLRYTHCTALLHCTHCTHQDVFICGWRRDLLDVLLELDKYVEPGSTATVFGSVPVEDRVRLLIALLYTISCTIDSMLYTISCAKSMFHCRCGY
jgi:hypothetical protein